MRLIKIFILTSALFYGVLNGATVTQTDDFESGSKNGWSDANTEIVDYPSPVDSNTLKITSENVWVSKIYNFGTQNANSQATIDLDLWAIGGWESWGPAIDFVYIEINGVMVVNRETITGANSKIEEVKQHYNFTVSTDSSGSVEIKIKYDVSAPADEYLLLDDVKVSIDSNLTFYAADDNYATPPDNPVVENVLANDFGQGIHVISHTDPANGTLTISFDGNFTYTPSAGFIGTDTFTYTIQDENNNTDSATVTIEVQTQLSEGKLLPFSLINPPNTRNIIGDYKIAGNTVLCLTELTSGYGGTCHGEGDYQDITSNMHVTKYLDIDNDPSTWNSTSSYIEVPDTFDPDRGVIWAGLFWQGRISVDKDYPIRYGIEEENTYDLIEVGNGTTITIDRFDIMQSGAVDIKLKINSSDYNDVIANTFHVFESDNGQTYAAYADVTNLFSTNRLQVGKNTFTVANLTTMEGREPSPGAFGGWSLVVIYAEDYTKGSPKNISIYNGFISIDETNDPIEISGFKLPENGDIKAQLSVFSGEGEYRYGRTPYNSAEDWMKISDNEDSGYDYMPGLPSGTDVGNRDNMFDARLNNILRDEFVNGIRNSFSTNNVGVDVDNYDISELMTQYRDNNPDVNSVYIQMYSDNDYITPSMMAFSSELYIPNICYDYTFDIDGYVLDSAENDVNTTLHTLAPNKPLRTHLLIRSLEGDFPLENAEFSVTVKDPTMAKYISGSAMQAIYNINEYEPAGDLVHNESDAGFNLYFGEGATPDHGGTMYANQSNYILFDYETNQSKPRLETTFYFDVNFTVDYGSGPVTIYKQLNADSRCPTSTVYEPEWGIFNVISDPTKPTTYNLITQVSGRPFDIHGIFYDADYTTPKSIKTGVEIEVINANFFKSDTNASCNNPDSNTTEPIYVMFNNSSTTASIQNNPDFALRNSAFRIWYLEDNKSTFVPNTCTTREDEACMKALYDSKFASFDTMCKTACDGTQTPGTCYGCLKKYHAKPLCSRDNFSIRPETFKIYIGDNNQNVDSLPVQVAINDTVNQTNLSADYDYLMSLTATRYNTNEESK
ncbi:MAG: cadherin-like domain-containing protein, partial [Hydrogenimonas sp.]|nr:cadherin-like domain-containing protein [Hydrogenimonas sp.]